MKKISTSFLTLRLIQSIALLMLAACNVTRPPATTPPSAPTAASAPATSAPSSPIAPPDSWTDLGIYQPGLVSSARPILNEMTGASVYHISLTIDADLVHVEGHELVHYTNREDVPLTEIQMRLFPNILGGQMTYDNLLVDNAEIDTDLQMINSLLILHLNEPLAIGASVAISMDFAIEVPTSVELNYGVQASYNGVLTLAHAYPMIAVYNEEGWNAEIPPQSGDVTFADMSFFYVSITAPDDVTIVASGEESVPERSARQQVVHVAAGPARDFFVAASRDYEVISQTVGGVTINSYAPKADRAGSQIALEVAARAIETFSDLFTQYPYSELDIVSTPTLALGVEYPGAVAIADRLYSDAYYAERTNDYRESTVAHEVAHQWFYNLIGNDQLDEPWLDESLAQFATWEYYRVNYGAEAASEFEFGLLGRWGRVENALVAIDQPVAAFSSSEYGAIVYGRGPLFFGALRTEIGEENFSAFIKDYAQTFSWGIASAEGLRALAEKHCGCDLSALFEEWIYP